MMTAMMNISIAWITSITIADITRPTIIEGRVTGVANIFDNIPISISWSIPIPAQAEPKMTVITTTPGAKNCR
jgi:hypothetical protein